MKDSWGPLRSQLTSWFAMQDALHSNTLHKVAINILDGKEGLLVERYWLHLQVR